MDQRIEAFLTDVLALVGSSTGRELAKIVKVKQEKQ
jgi:hypothetical protein